MQRKDRLAKLIEKSSSAQTTNYEVLEKVKEQTNWDEITNDGRIKDIRQKKVLLLIIASIVFVLAIIGIFLSVILPNQSYNPLVPDIKFYHYNEDNIILYNSINEYIENKNNDFIFFDQLYNIEEEVKVYIDNKKEILINQHIFIEETLETIILYVELENNYMFDFLDEYNNLDKQISINNIEIDYKIRYEESTYSYLTYVKFKYNDKLYRVSFDLIEEDGWKTYLEQLIK